MIEKCRQSCPIIDIHASWLAINPIHGCPYRCVYCFMNAISNTNVKPTILISPKEAVNKILSYEFYDENFPICAFTSTEIFSTKENIEYAEQFLVEYVENKIPNVLILITKHQIPKEFIKKVDALRKKGLKIIFMLSYSGLDASYETGLTESDIHNNFKLLHQFNIPIVHYWRPFLPNNSSIEKLNKVLSFVKNYAVCSVAIGLKVNNDFIENLYFWQELREKSQIALSSESIWTQNAYDFIENQTGKYPIFKATSCAISYTLNIADYNAIRDSFLCNKNQCPYNQREKCYRQCKTINKENIMVVLNKVGITQNDFEIKNNKIIIDKKLTTSQKVFIKMSTSLDVVSDKANDYYWNTSNNTNRILILGNDQNE